MNEVKFDYKVLSTKLVVGTLVIVIYLIGLHFKVLPPFQTPEAFFAFASGIYGTAIGIDLLTFAQAKKKQG